MSQEDNLHVRVALLEARQLDLQKDMDQLFQLMRDHMENEEERWKNIQETLSKWKGFTGGVIFVVTSIWAVITLGMKFFVK